MSSCDNMFKKLDELEQQYIKFWEELCLIESPTDYKKGVDASSNYIIEKAKAYGWKIERQKQNVSGDFICITMNPDSEKAPVCLSGHLDTVHPVGLFKEPVVRIDNEKIYGPGVCDCKGGVVAAFYAMAALAETGFKERSIKLLLQSDEETSSKGSNQTTIKYMCECARDAVAFINCEPYGNATAVLERKGIAKFTFNITGKAKHASICYEGVNAITEAAHKIIELEKHKNPDGITANCGTITGGTKINTVPEECSFSTDFRFSNDAELEEVKNIAKAVAETSYIEGTTCKVVCTGIRNAMELNDTNIKLLERVNKIFEAYNIPKHTMRSARGGSDAAYTTQYGIPTLDSLGAEGGQYHSKEEFAYLSSLKESAKRMAVICRYI